jgi:glycerophosphoryl diester phosphodiesterase
VYLFRPIMGPADALRRPNALHSRWDLVNEQTITAAHRQGLEVNPWTCNEPDIMQRFIKWGVDAIITDRPDLLYDLLYRSDSGE